MITIILIIRNNRSCKDLNNKYVHVFMFRSKILICGLLAARYKLQHLWHLWLTNFFKNHLHVYLRVKDNNASQHGEISELFLGKNHFISV